MTRQKLKKSIKSLPSTTLEAQKIEVWTRVSWTKGQVALGDQEYTFSSAGGSTSGSLQQDGQVPESGCAAADGPHTAEGADLLGAEPPEEPPQRLQPLRELREPREPREPCKALQLGSEGQERPVVEPVVEPVKEPVKEPVVEPVEKKADQVGSEEPGKSQEREKGSGSLPSVRHPPSLHDKSLPKRKARDQWAGLCKGFHGNRVCQLLYPFFGTWT